jgi:uncharacterized small protein (DUF1192 family)
MEIHLRSLAARLREVFPAQRRLFLAGGLLAGVFLMFLLAANQNVLPVHPKIDPPTPFRTGQSGEVTPLDVPRTMSIDTKESIAGMSARVPAKAYSGGPVDSAGFLPEPRIAYSAELSVVTREFAHSRSSLEEILERHRGYVAKLRLVGQPSGSVLSATLRVPSSEYRSAFTELKAVGFVEHEEEAADEITQQHGELEARLVNAQNEEQRIQRILQNQAQKFYDSRPLERQVALLRAEIERIESERSASSSRVSFANVSFSLREERTSPAETVGAKLRSAAVGGLSDAFESISAILLFLAARGPLLALWAVLIFLPARFFWRRRSQWGLREAEAPKNS